VTRSPVLRLFTTETPVAMTISAETNNRSDQTGNWAEAGIE
jgi:hypothetical protein